MPPPKRHPMALAVEWVAKITTVSLEMVIPGLIGTWLDKRWGTSFLALVGFGIGLTVALWHLLQMASPPKSRPPRDDNRLEA